MYLSGKLRAVLTAITIVCVLVLAVPSYAGSPAVSTETLNDLYGQPVAGEESVVGALDPQFAWDIGLKMEKFGSTTNGWGYRLTGTDAGKETAAYLTNVFKSIGLEPDEQKFPVDASNYVSSSLNLTGAIDKTIPVMPEIGTEPTPAGGVKGELVFVNYATQADLDGADLSDRIALVAWNYDYMPWVNDAAYQCQMFGAKAVILYCDTYYAQDPSGEAFYQACMSGSAMPDIPVAAIPSKYAKELISALEQGSVNADLNLNVSNYQGTGSNIVAEIPGTKYPDEYIVITAHRDAHFYGFQDDALPVGMMLSMAKAIKESGYQPERTIIFAALDAEETGALDTYYTWLIGSWNFTKDNAAILEGKTIANINLELMGAKEKEKLAVRTSDTLSSFVKSAADSFTTTAYKDAGIETMVDMANWDDSYCFSYHGIPGLTTDYLYEEVNQYYYHSQFENHERADFAKVKDLQKFYATLLVRLDQSDLSPYDLTLTPEKYIQSMDAAALQDLGASTAALTEASSYLEKSRTLFEKQAAVEQALSEAREKGKDVAAAEALLDDYNQGIRQAAKTVLQGTQYLDQGTNCYHAPYYATLVSQFDSVIGELEKGNGSKAIENAANNLQWYYSEFLGQETFAETYKEPMNVDGWKGDLYWATGRLEKYYDVYDTLASIREKNEWGDTNYTEEIAKLTEYRNDAVNRMNTALNKDSAMWVKASDELPLSVADRILEQLK